MTCYYVVLNEAHICRSQIGATGYCTVKEPTLIMDDFGTFTGFYVLKIMDKFADLFIQQKKFTKEEVGPILQKAKDKTLTNSDITWT